eukprot:9495384-Lingulodinium_polyedra.AAC.1
MAPAGAMPTACGDAQRERILHEPQEAPAARGTASRGGCSGRAAAAAIAALPTADAGAPAA